MATRFCIWFEEPDAPPPRAAPSPTTPLSPSGAAATILEPLVEAAAPESRALATANPMSVGRFLYDEDAHELILRLHFAGNVTVLRYKVLLSTGLRERSVTMFAPPEGDDGSGEVLPSVVTSHLDILDVCHGGRHGHEVAAGFKGAAGGGACGAEEATPATADPEVLDPASPRAAFSPAASTVRTSVVDFEGFGASVAARMGGLYQPCLSGVMFKTPFSQDAGGWVADGFASAQSCLRLSASEKLPPVSGRKGYHFHPTLPSLPPDAMAALEQSFSTLAFTSTPAQRMPGLPMITHAGEGVVGAAGPDEDGWLLAWAGMDTEPGGGGPPLPPWETPLSPVTEPLLDGGVDLYEAAAATSGAPPYYPAAKEPAASSAGFPPPPPALDWTAAERELLEALHGTPLPPPPQPPLPPFPPPPAPAPPSTTSEEATACLSPPLPSETRQTPASPARAEEADRAPPGDAASAADGDVRPSAAQIEGFSRLFTIFDSSGESTSEAPLAGGGGGGSDGGGGGLGGQ